MSRKSKDEFFMRLAYLYSEQSTCLKRKVGCVIVRDGIQLSGGYNGAPKDLPHCEKCKRIELNVHSGEKPEICRGGHSEGNAIAQAAMNGVNINNSTLYCTTKPCIYCSKLIVNSGIKRIVYCEEYGNNNMDDLTKEILQNIIVEKMEKPQ